MATPPETTMSPKPLTLAAADGHSLQASRFRRLPNAVAIAESSVAWLDTALAAVGGSEMSCTPENCTLRRF
jgi:hypothetical protein